MCGSIYATIYLGALFGVDAREVKDAQTMHVVRQDDAVERMNPATGGFLFPCLSEEGCDGIEEAVTDHLCEDGFSGFNDKYGSFLTGDVGRGGSDEPGEMGGWQACQCATRCGMTPATNQQAIVEFAGAAGAGDCGATCAYWREAQVENHMKEGLKYGCPCMK